MTPHGIGCLLFAVGVGAAFAITGAGIEWLLAQLGQRAAFPGQIAFLAGADGLGVASIWYWRSTRRVREYGPCGAFAVFVLLGIRFGGGRGVVGITLFGIANGLFGLLLTSILLRRSERNELNDTSDQDGSR